MKRQITTLAVALVAALALASSAQAAAPPLVGKFCNGVQGDSAAGQCVVPRGVAVDESDGHIYVADQGNNRIQELTIWGEFVRTWGGGVVSGGAVGRGDLAAGSVLVSGVVTDKKVFEPGRVIEGTGIAPGTRIAAVGDGTITLSQPATTAGAGVELVTPEGSGNVANDETQRITVTATDGTYNLSFQTPNPSPSAATTGVDIPYNATAAEVQSALEGLANIGAGNVSVTSSTPGGEAGVPGGPYTVEFDGPRFADTDVDLLGVVAGEPALSGGTAIVAAVTRGASAAEICQVAVECRGGTEGARAGQVSSPQGVAVDASGAVFVVEGRRVQKFDSSGNFVLAFGGEVDKTTKANLCTAASGDECGAGVAGALPGFFSNAPATSSYIDVGPGNRIYVGDKDRVQVFDANGIYAKSIAIPGEAVQSLAVDDSGNLYVSYFGSVSPEQESKPDVRKLSDAGEVLCTMQVANPRGIAVGGGLAYVINRPTERAGVMEFAGSNCAPVDIEVPSPGFGELATPLGTSPTGIATVSAPTCGLNGTDVLVSNPSFEGSFLALYGSAPDANVCPPPLAAPSIDSRFATSVATTDASLRARINPHFWPDTRYFVEYGTGKCSEGGCDQEQPASPGALLTPKTIDASLATPEVFLEGLEPNTVYHYRFVAESGGGGPTVGEEGSFRTLPLPGQGADTCPNQVFRTGAAARLPDCRGYEMVSPLDKENGDVSTGEGSFAQAAFDGTRMTFSSIRSFADPESSPLNNQYLATRAADGWETASIASPDTSFALYGAANNVDGIRYKDFSDDLCLGWLIQSTDVALTPGSPLGVANFYRRDLCNGGYQLLTSSPPPGFGRGEEVISSFYPELQGTSEDGSRAAFRANASLETQAGDPRAPVSCLAGDKDATFAWLRDGAPIPGAEADEYSPAVADEGTALQCRTISANEAGASVATGKVMAIGTDEPRAPRPPKVTGASAESPPAATLSGAPELGGTLTCTPGQWLNEPSFSYRWLRNGNPIAGAEAADYTLVHADASAVVQCEVVATNAGGTAVGDSEPLLIAADPPLASAPPTISGTPEVGQTLTCDPGTWTGDPTFSYRWLRNGAVIATGTGATSASRPVAAGDAGKTLQCRVTAANADADVVATSARVVVPAAPATTPPQQSSPGSLSGVAEVGQTLTCDPGSWSGSPTFNYKWLRNGALIPGAEASNYALQAADAGTAVQCQVSAANAGGTAVAIEGSAADVRYLAPDPAPTAPLASAYSYSVHQVYLAHEGGLSLVSVLPDGMASTERSSVGTSQTGSSLFNSGKLGKPGRNAVHNALSADGERVFWTTALFEPGDDSAQGTLYLRINATEPQSAVVAGQCSEPEKACTLPVSELATPEPARFLDADTQGTRAFFGAAGRLYEYEGGSTPRTSEIAGGFLGFLGASKDATRAYFTSTEVLTGSQENSEGDLAAVGKANLYLYEVGVGFTFVAILNFLDGAPGNDSGSASFLPDLRISRVAPDGNTVAFTTRGQLTDYDSLEAVAGKQVREVYVYTHSEDELLCASCNPSGARPRAKVVGSSITWAAATLPGWVSQTHPGGALSDDGKRVFFNAYDSLVPGDTNGKADVYQWELTGKGDCSEASPTYSPSNGGCIALISSGQSSSDSELFDATPSGSDVFFATSSSLVAQDKGLVDVYDARVGGGFPQPPPPAPSCEGEACQGTPSPPQDQTPASSTFQGAGNVVEGPPPRRPCAKGKVRRKGRCVKKHKHTSSKPKAKKHAKAGHAGADRRNAR